jgi:hypothetical protein
MKMCHANVKNVAIIMFRSPLGNAFQNAAARFSADRPKFFLLQIIQYYSPCGDRGIRIVPK